MSDQHHCTRQTARCPGARRRDFAGRTRLASQAFARVPGLRRARARNRSSAAFTAHRAIPLPAGLASRTQFRVQLRLQEMREREPKRRALWAAVRGFLGLWNRQLPLCLALVPVVRRTHGVPKLVWSSASGCGGRYPRCFVLIVFVMEKKSAPGGEPDWIRPSK